MIFITNLTQMLKMIVEPVNTADRYALADFFVKQHYLEQVFENV